MGDVLVGLGCVNITREDVVVLRGCMSLYHHLPVVIQCANRRPIPPPVSIPMEFMPAATK